MHTVCIMGVKMNRSSLTLLAAAISLAAISGADAAPPTKTATTMKGPTRFLNGAWHLARP
jgi:hypothetical protein